MVAVSRPTEPGISPPKGLELKNPLFEKWLQLLQAAFPRVRTVKATLNPASVAANSEDTQTFTIEGLTTNDIVEINKPSDTAGLSLSQWWVSAADTLSVKFRNHTGGAIDPPSEDYLIKATRL